MWGGRRFEHIGEFTIAGNELVVELSSLVADAVAGQVVIADAVRIELVPTAPLSLANTSGSVSGSVIDISGSDPIESALVPMLSLDSVESHDIAVGHEAFLDDIAFGVIGQVDEDEDEDEDEDDVKDSGLNEFFGQFGL